MSVVQREFQANALQDELVDKMPLDQLQSLLASAKLELIQKAQPLLDKNRKDHSELAIKQRQLVLEYNQAVRDKNEAQAEFRPIKKEYVHEYRITTINEYDKNAVLYKAVELAEKIIGGKVLKRPKNQEGVSPLRRRSQSSAPTYTSNSILKAVEPNRETKQTSPVVLSLKDNTLVKVKHEQLNGQDCFVVETQIFK